MSEQERGFSTRCIHDGEQMGPDGALHTPLYNHSTFGFRSTQAILDVIEGRAQGNLYTRFGFNPTIQAAERKLAGLEGGEAALAFGSGMAAISAAFLGFCRGGDHIVCLGDVYGGTFELLHDQLPGLGVQTSFIADGDLAEAEQAITAHTRVLFFETPSNPTMQIIDIAAVAALARRRGVLTIIDNTFASPVNQSPLSLGADLVVHSATKYLGGHSDLTGGVVIGAQALLDAVSPWRKNLGQIMAPDVAFLLLRSLRTLAVRVHQQNATAQAVAEFLQGHPKIDQIHYPGLPDSPGHEIARRQMRGFGGMLSFVFAGDQAATAAVVDRLRLFAIAPSLGGVESLATQPVTTTHHGMPADERKRRGITDNLVRLSCGLEDAADLIADLRQALD